MKFAIMGAGAIGCYFGARLSAAGEEVHFISRGAHLAAMRKNGLKIESDRGNLHLTNPLLTDNPATVGPVDYILFCVKLWDIDATSESIKPLIKNGTAILSLQNGVYAEGRLVELLGPEYVIGGSAYTPATIIEPGLVRQYGKLAKLEFSELNNVRTSRIEFLYKACLDSGIDAEIPADIEASLWSKFVTITTLSGATSLCRSTIGPIRSNSWGLNLIKSLANETIEIAKAKGIKLDPEYANIVFERMMNFPPDTQGSMATDLHKGARLELEWLNGMVSKFGLELGIPTPANDAVMMGLSVHAMGQIT